MDCNQIGTVTEAEIVERLEQAGRTLVAMKDVGYRPNLAQRRHDVVHSLWDAFDWKYPPFVRLPAPGIDDLRLMDEAYEWVMLIPANRMAMRRVVQCRSLVNPVNDRYLYSWRKLAAVLHLDHKAVQRIHAEGIKKIIEGLDKRPTKQLEKPHDVVTRH